MKGEFVRKESGFRNWVTADGRPGPSGEGDFTAEPGRYHLYISYACPWAHRTMLYRSLQGLQDIISFSVVDPRMPPESWVFGDYPGCTPDQINGAQSMAQIYAIAEPKYDGVVSVPVLWDKQRHTIVNNESSEIIRILNTAFNAWGRADLDFYPEPLREQIDVVNNFVYDNINNGVYQVGFAATQAAYEAAFDKLFAALDELEQRLDGKHYLVAEQPTEADWRLFPTLLRFDPVYYCHFKCNRQRLIDYPDLWAYTRRLYQHPGVMDTINMDHIKCHYFSSHKNLNPSGIIPKGPVIDFTKPVRNAGQEDFRRPRQAADPA